MKPRARHWTAFAVLAACTVFGGGNFVLCKASVLVQAPLAVGESSWFIAAHNLAPRFAIGVLFLVAIYRGQLLRLTQREWTQGIFMAVMSFCGCLLQTDGLQRTTAGTTAFLGQTYVIFIPLWWSLIQRRRPSKWVLAASLLVLAGGAVLARVDWHTFRVGRGEAEVLMSTVFFSVLLCSLNWPGFASNRAECTSTVMFLIEGVMFAAVAVAACRAPAHLFTPYASPAWVAIMIVAAVLGTAGPFVLINRWQRFIAPTEAGLLYSFGPVVAALTEVVLPAPLSRWTGIDYANQPLTPVLLLGGTLILSANVLIQLRPEPPPKSAG
jgi:drug/metabolite transporter (DMT)-like permease